MADLNSCTFTGRLTANAVSKTLPNGTNLVEFSMANNKGFGDNQKVLFLRVNVWGKQGQTLLPYLIKGKSVGVAGELELHTWTGKADGMEHQQLVLDSKQVILMGSGTVSTTDTTPTILQEPEPEVQF